MSSSFLDNLKDLAVNDEDWRNGLTDEEGDDDSDMEVPSRGSFIGHVLFKTPVPDIEALQARLPEFGFAVVDEDEEEEDEADTDDTSPQPFRFICTKLDLKGLSFYAPLPSLPADEVEYFARNNYFWADGTQAVAQQQSALMVSVLGSDEDDPRDCALSFVLAVAAVLQDDNAIGVYLNKVVYAREQFLQYLDEALEADNGKAIFPVKNLIWCAANMTEEEPDTITVRTYGCESFGHKNMEIRGVPEDNDAVLKQINILTMVSAYTILKNIDFQSGEIFDYSDTDQRLIKEVPSLFDDEPILLLDPVQG